MPLMNLCLTRFLIFSYVFSVSPLWYRFIACQSIANVFLLSKFTVLSREGHMCDHWTHLKTNGMCLPTPWDTPFCLQNLSYMPIIVSITLYYKYIWGLFSIVHYLEGGKIVLCILDISSPWRTPGTIWAHSKCLLNEWMTDLLRGNKQTLLQFSTLGVQKHSSSYVSRFICLGD